MAWLLRLGDIRRLGSRPGQYTLCEVLCFFCASRTVCIALGFYLFFNISALPIVIKIFACLLEWPQYQQVANERIGTSPGREGFIPFHNEDYFIGPLWYFYFRNHWSCAMGVGIHPVEMRTLRRFVFFVPAVLFCFSPVWVPSADLH